jgi:glycerol-3-phosphate dehydrogenase
MDATMNRQAILSTLKTASPTVLVVGGGINGVGTFRDLALNGVDVLLVDRADFCSGASAASSHMAHGGIRYMENGEFRLVREAVQERNRMIENAPHLVRPLPTTIPTFKIFSGLLNAPFKFMGWLDKPSERGALVIKIGLIVYDTFTRAQKTVPRHWMTGRRKALAKFPRMNPSIRYAANYYDGLIVSPERLTLELLLEGEAEGEHARALNYMSVKNVDGQAVCLRDELSGEEYQISPRLVINAAGPWIDFTNENLGLSTQYIGGTRGAHLVLKNDELRQEIGDHMIFFELEDARLVLILPLLDKILVGTSEHAIQDPDQARCTQDEVDYFIGMIGRVFPDIQVDPSQIVFRFSGVRPLPNIQAKTVLQVTRDHRMHEDFHGSMPVYSLVGGKWTSFRAFSEQVTDKALAFLGLSRKAGTHNLPIGGGRDYPHGQENIKKWVVDLQASTGMPSGQVETLFQRYGTRARQVCEFILAGQDAPFVACPSFSHREIQFLVRAEKIIHLDDLLLRRTLLAYLGELSLDLIEEMAEVVGSELEWDALQIKNEVERSLDILADKHSVTFESLPESVILEKS